MSSLYAVINLLCLHAVANEGDPLSERIYSQAEDRPHTDGRAAVSTHEGLLSSFKNQHGGAVQAVQ